MPGKEIDRERKKERKKKDYTVEYSPMCELRLGLLFRYHQMARQKQSRVGDSAVGRTISGLAEQG